MLTCGQIRFSDQAKRDSWQWSARRPVRPLSLISSLSSKPYFIFCDANKNENSESDQIPTGFSPVQSTYDTGEEALKVETGVLFSTFNLFKFRDNAYVSIGARSTRHARR